MNERFEYMTEDLRYPPTKEWLNNLGAERWEMCGVFASMIQSSSTGLPCCFHVVFKRSINAITESLKKGAE